MKLTDCARYVSMVFTTLVAVLGAFFSISYVRVWMHTSIFVGMVDPHTLHVIVSSVLIIGLCCVAWLISTRTVKWGLWIAAPLLAVFFAELINIWLWILAAWWLMFFVAALGGFWLLLKLIIFIQTLSK